MRGSLLRRTRALAFVTVTAHGPAGAVAHGQITKSVVAF